MLAVAGAGDVHAEPEREAAVGDETIIIVDQAPQEGARDRRRALGDAPFVTILHPDDHPATASVADALATSAGAQTRSLGGLGAYQSVSVRGAAPGHTSVLIDGVPLARIAAVTTDLGRFSLDSFGEVELYRGAVPVELGGAGVGGAVNLVTRLGRGEHGERVRASLGVGSFGARHLRAHYGDDHEHVKSSTTLGYQGADGDYTYFDDNGTLLNQRDDGYRTRGNNGFAQLDAATRVGAHDGSAAGGLRLAYKDQGLPGSTAQPALATSMATLNAIADGNLVVDVGRATAKQLAYVLVERQHLDDPMGELGLGPADRTYVTLSGGATSTWSVPVAAHRLVGGVELRGDRFVDRDERGQQPELTGTRAGGAATLAVDVNLAPQLVATPALRLDVLRSAPTPMTAGPSALVMVDPRWDVVPSPRFTTRLAVSDEVSIKSSAGYYVRLPTLLEVFGNRGYIVGSPELRPERGPSGDLGMVWAPARARGAVDRILVQTDVFAARARDTIALITTAGFVARAVNIGNTQSYGAELMASARFARTLTATASYTRLVTEQMTIDTTLDGKRIPRKPPHALYGRLDAVCTFAGRTAAVWVDGAWQAESYLDAANLARVPARLLLGSGVRAEIGAGFALSASVANLTDERISLRTLDPPPSPTLTQTPTPLTDVAGFPLPGRSFYLSLDWTY
ncbi:MAG: TonB-dependent receptor [Kofleriaceae bacterium]|nr:TonB-dependent receptor [Kofleriaceae bacterium]